MAEHGPAIFLMASTLLFAAPFVAVTAAVAGDGTDTGAVTRTTPDAVAPDGVTLHPFVANALDRRDVVRPVATGAPGTADTYVERVPRAFGLTLHAPF